MATSLQVPDAPGVAGHGLAEVAPRRRPPADPTDVVGLAALTAIPCLAAATEEAVVGTGGRPPVTLLPTVAGRPIPVGLAMGLALEAASARPSGVADGVVLQGGEAALAPVVVTPGPTTRLDAGLVLAAWPCKARTSIHVGRRRIARPRTAAASNAAGEAKGREIPN